MRLIVHYDEPEQFLDVLEKRDLGVEVKVVRDYASLPQALHEFQPDAFYGIRFMGKENYPGEALFSTPSLKWVAIGGSGIDHLPAWDPEKVTVTNVAGVASDSMAQYVMACLLAFEFDLPAFERRRQRHAWEKTLVGSVEGKTILVIGLGATGKDVARRAEALGMHVLGVRANPRTTPHVGTVYASADLPAVIGEADYIAVCVPLTEETRGWIDRSMLEKAKPGAILVDVSRGGIIVGDDLIWALGEGPLAAAGLDVFETEPLPPESPFWDLENVIITPHCSAIYEGWERRSFEMFCENLERFVKGEALQSVVDPARGY